MIKSTVNEDTVKPTVYPYLGVADSTGVIVLFLKKNCGVVIANPTGIHPMGYYTSQWMETQFTPITHSITLSNK